MPLIYFIAGILFIYFVVPLVEGLAELILAWIEKIKTAQAVEIYKIKQSVTEEEEETPRAVVGFVYQEEEEEE